MNRARSAGFLLWASVGLAAPTYGEAVLDENRSSDEQLITPATVPENTPATPLVEQVIEGKAGATGEENRNWWQRTLDSLEAFRDSTSRGVGNLSHNLDEYFSGEELEKRSSKSYVKLEFKNSHYKGGEMEQDVKLKGKLDLPNTKRKVKLVFTSSAELERPLEERVTDTATGERVKKDDSFAGVEFTPEKTKSPWDTNFTAGIKLRTPLLPFAKYELDNSWQLSELWNAAFDQTFWYLDDEGFGETSEVNFTRPLSQSMQLRFGSELEFRDKDNNFNFDLIPSISHRITDDSSLEYYTGLFAESRPSSQVTSYIIGTTYRKRLHEDWLYLNLEPQLSFPEEEDWEIQPSFTLRLQVYFEERAHRH